MGKGQHIEKHQMFFVVNLKGHGYNLLAVTKYHAIAQAVMLDCSKFPTHTYKVYKKYI